jgi:hypothetical protein
VKPAGDAPAFGPPPPAAFRPPPPPFNPPPPPAFQPPPGYAPPAFQPPQQYAPPQQQYAPPPPAFAPPPAMPMGYGAAAAPNPMTAGPMPPSLHWVLVWLLGGITFGLFTLIWIFKQAGFVKKINPSSKAVLLMTLSVVGQFVLLLGAVGLIAVSASSGSFHAGVAGIMGIVMLLSLVIAVMWLVAIFGMRSSLVRYYNSVEPMGLKLSGVMTFFFNILYFQYHLTRIANWKKTGVLG